MEEPTSALKIFISYSHKDENYKDLLIVHLASLKRRGVINEWNDRMLVPGQEWDGFIKQELLDADIIILLISADFLASNYCFDVEIKKAIDRHESNKAKIIPVILRPCDWTDLPFGKIQALPKDAKPISKWSDLDEGYLNVIQGIRACANNINSSKKLSIEPKVEVLEALVITEELGLIDYEDLINENIPVSISHLTNISSSMEWFTGELRKKTNEITAITTKGASNSRNDLKIIFIRTSKIMNRFAKEIEPEILLQHKSFGKLIEYFTNLMNIYKSDFQVDKAEVKETKLSLIELQKSIVGAKSSMNNFYDSIDTLPRMSKEINSSKNNIINQIANLINNLDEDLIKINNLLNLFDSILDN